MDLSWVVARLEVNAGIVQALCAGVDHSQAIWRPGPGRWSILEVVNHMVDEEIRDFRRRIEITLRDPGEAWPPIDPERWAVDEAYNERSLGTSVSQFLHEREASIAWLGGLRAAVWDRAHEHPRMGTIRAGDLLSSWVAHDFIHIRQINRLHREYLVEAVLPEYSSDYAGKW